MASSTAPTTFGVTVVSTAQKNNDTKPIYIPGSPAITPAVSRNGSQADTHPVVPPVLIPLYERPPAAAHNKASQAGGSCYSIKDTVAIFEKDVESGNATPLSRLDEKDPFGQVVSIESNQECTMWPSKQTLKQQRREDKKSRRDKKGCASCAPVVNAWSTLSKKQKLIAKITIALLLVGVAVALGVAISVAVKGTYYVSNGNSRTVGR